MQHETGGMNMGGYYFGGLHIFWWILIVVVIIALWAWMNRFRKEK